MEDYTFLAGQSLNYTLEGTDSYGNAVDVSAAQVLANDGNLLISPSNSEENSGGKHVWHRCRPLHGHRAVRRGH